MIENTTVSRNEPSGIRLVTAQHAVLLGAEACDRRAALLVHPVRPELDGDAVQRLERVRQQQALGFGVQRGPLHALRVPRRPDLETPVRGVDVHERRHADCLVARRLDHG